MKIVPRKKTAPYTILTGDVREMLRTLPDGSVHCVVTSPPYCGLRDYGCDGQLGLEPTIELYVEHMVEVFRELRRVLRKDGTLWLNMGDCYHSGNRGGYRKDSHQWENCPIQSKAKGSHMEGPAANRLPQEGLKDKDLVGQPWRVAFALQADGWWLRSDIIWAKPNPMPESCRDRPTKSHEYVFLMTKAPKYFFDQEAVREPHKEVSIKRMIPHRAQPGRTEREYGASRPDGGKNTLNRDQMLSPGGRNIRSVWTITTQAFPEAHFATFPERLVERCVKAGTSEKGCCPECGAPFVRVVKKIGGTQDPARGWDTAPGSHGSEKRRGTPKHPRGDQQSAAGRIALNCDQNRDKGGEHDNPFPMRKTTGWSPTCEHDAEPVPCTVLDPFIGSGTTALVAVKLGRRAIGIDLSAKYTNMVEKQLAVAVLGGYRRPRKFRFKGRKKIRRRVE